MNIQNDLVELNVTGMHCNNCALSVHKMLEKKGLKDINVDFANEEVKFSGNQDVSLPSIIKDIENLGFKVYETDDIPKEKFYDKIENRFYFSLIFAVPLFSHMFLPFHWLHNPYIQLVLCLPVFILGFIHFGKSAFNSVKSGVPNMDVLVFVGFTSAFIYSLIGTFLDLGPSYMFYETTAVIITLVLLGNVFEKRSVSQTTSAIKDLLKYQNIKATRINNGIHETIDSRLIQSGDTLLVNTGDKIPSDGDIIWGDASVNESLITGESIPVEKTKYDSVIGGTIVEQGSIKITATKVGKHSVLSQIIEIMKRAQSSKPPIQRLGDKVASIFVPVVIAISLITFILSYFAFNIDLGEAIMRSIAVLVISCPCAMGLATPTAVMVGLGRAAKKGVFIKGGATVEEMANLKYMVFDKTGTLTTGDFNIKTMDVIGIDKEEAASIIVGLESYSNHPIARSLIQELQSRAVQKFIFTEVNEIKGMGIKAIDKDGNTYEIGSNKVIEPQSLSKNEENYDIYLKRNDLIITKISIEDQLKPDAKELIDILKKQKITPILLSGDRKEKCDAVAQKLGIDVVFSEKLPQEKLEIINSYKEKGTTAMVGDGINDAPALTTANVGISLGNASQIAIQSAKVILLNNDLKSVTTLLKVGKHTLITIKQNLFWAFFYNIFAIPLAALGFLGPMLAALAMASSDVVVIGNSLRLKIKKLN